MASLFSRNSGEYLFDLGILFVLGITAAKKTPWSFKTLFYRTGFNWLLFAFYTWLFIGLAANPPLESDSIRLLVEFLWIPGIFLMARLLNLWKPNEKFFQVFSIIVIFSISYLIAHFVIYPEIGDHWGLPNRLRGTFTNTNFLAHAYISTLLLLSSVCGCFIVRKQKISIALTGLASLALLAALILTFTRSVWIALIVGIPLALFLINKKAAVTALLGIMLAFTAIYASDFGGTRSRIEQSLTPEKTYDAVRLALWRTNFKIFKDHPLIGVGYMNNKRDIVKYYQLYQEPDARHSYDTHAHNEILSFLAGTGVIGTALYLALFVAFFILGIKTLRTVSPAEPIQRGLLIGAIAIQPSFLVAGLADNNFEIHVARNWLVISWIILIWLASEKNVRLGQRRP
ncbi:MAG: O-antigen ligase family protein [Bdellovibrio sp.]